MRHPLHAICPYYAMFPERFVEKNLIWATEESVVFDPFCGRGTTVFESLRSGFAAAGCDVNPVAVCVSKAKADPPILADAELRLARLEEEFYEVELEASENDLFFNRCFHEHTLKQILYLRRALQWESRTEDTFIAAVALGCLHGESDRSGRYFSNQMPRTISTKPNYSVRWWDTRKLAAPKRDVFSIIRNELKYRLSEPTLERVGKVLHSDAREAGGAFPELHNKVSLVVTSPPYLDTTNFAEDQWLRRWFLGGPPRPTRDIVSSDDRYRNADTYWRFLSEAWAGIAPLMKQNSRIIIRIGGKGLLRDDISRELSNTLAATFSEVKLAGVTESEIRGSQTRTFRAAKRKKTEFDFNYMVNA